MYRSFEISGERRSVLNPVDRARALAPLIAQHADTAEREGCMAPPVSEALSAAGLYRILAPRRAGGEAVTMRCFIETAAELGKSCPGSAWAYGVVTAATGAAACLPETQRELLFRRGDEVTCFISSKTGVATPSGPGFLVTGQWHYASGCLQSDWAWCGVVIHDDEGAPVNTGVAFIGLSDENVRIIRNWNVAGLAASGSNCVAADGCYVPSELVILDSELATMIRPAEENEIEPRDLWPLESQFAVTLVPSMLGAAEGMLEAVRRRMTDRPIIGWNYDSQSDSELLLSMLGQAAIKIDSAWMHIYRACDVADAIAQERTPTKLENVKRQADCGYAMALIREAADLLMDIAGPGAFALTNDIQRYWRDVSIGSRHNTLNSGLSMELLGRSLTAGKSNIRNMPEIS